MVSTGITVATLTPSVLGAALKPLITELIETAKKKINNPDRVVLKAISQVELGKRIFNVVNVKTLWNVEKEVSLFEFYYPSRLVFNGNGEAKPIANLSNFPRDANYVIQGTAGQGKSIFLRYLFGQIAFSLKDEQKIPLFIELRRTTSQKTIEGLISDALERLGLPQGTEFIESYLSSGKIVLLMDGFDEIEADLVSRAVYDIEGLASRFDDLQIIITSRPDAAIQQSALFRVVKIDPLRNTDHLPFLEKICANRTQAKEILDAIQKNEQGLGDLLSTPLLLTLLVLLYRAQSTLPSTLSRFYEQLFDVMFFKHDQTKPGFKRHRFTNLDEVQLKRVFEAFAFQSQISSTQIFSTSEFEECAKQASELTGIEVSASGFKKELIRTACLMIEDGLELSFIHKSVAEFYAAVFVQRASVEFAIDFYRQIIEQELSRSWSGELQFLAEIDAYRHAKYFLIPELRRTLNLIKLEELTVEAAKENEYLKKFRKRSKLHLSRDKQTWYLVGIGDFEQVPTAFGSVVAVHLAKSLLGSINPPSNNPALQQMANTVGKGRSVVVLDTVEAIELAGTKTADVLENALIEQVSSLGEELKRAESLVALEEGKRKLVPLLKKSN